MGRVTPETLGVAIGSFLYFHCVKLTEFQQALIVFVVIKVAKINA